MSGAVRRLFSVFVIRLIGTWGVGLLSGSVCRLFSGIVGLDESFQRIVLVCQGRCGLFALCHLADFIRYRPVTRLPARDITEERFFKRAEIGFHGPDEFIVIAIERGFRQRDQGLTEPALGVVDHGQFVLRCFCPFEYLEIQRGDSVGLLDDVVFECGDLPGKVGDLLFIFTDGQFEFRHTNVLFFGDSQSTANIFRIFPALNAASQPGKRAAKNRPGNYI